MSTTTTHSVPSPTTGAPRPPSSTQPSTPLTVRTGPAFPPLQGPLIPPTFTPFFPDLPPFMPPQPQPSDVLYSTSTPIAEHPTTLTLHNPLPSNLLIDPYSNWHWISAWKCPMTGALWTPMQALISTSLPTNQPTKNITCTWILDSSHDQLSVTTPEPPSTGSLPGRRKLPTNNPAGYGPSSGKLEDWKSFRHDRRIRCIYGVAPPAGLLRRRNAARVGFDHNPLIEQLGRILSSVSIVASLAGKETYFLPLAVGSLIHSVICAIPNYWLGHNKIPARSSRSSTAPMRPSSGRATKFDKASILLPGRPSTAPSRKKVWPCGKLPIYPVPCLPIWCGVFSWSLAPSRDPS
ncbi:hypothetical protein MRB53_016864 [Persea americana]|uniref:Uncharacterized protein n=1 Tax=Persea americana TaxID=3435 RepID=A0ACC2M3H5_PERAE|nr:hypothetical protein MRB53_016864 [Persea americana]